MVNYPGHIEPSAGSFRTHMSATTPPGDATPTQRINKLRQAPAQRVLSQPAVAPRPRDQESGRGQRTRRTVDLPASTHRALDIWQREAADRLGVARVTGQDVLAALIDQLLIDPKLADQIIRALDARR